MDFLTILSYILAVVETGALIGTLIFVTQALQEKKNLRKKQGKKGGKSEELVQKTVKASFTKAAVAFVIYLLLNILRRYGGIFA